MHNSLYYLHKRYIDVRFHVVSFKIEIIYAPLLKYLWLEHDIILECNGIQFVSSERFSFIRKECNENSMLFDNGIYYPIRWYEGKNDSRNFPLMPMVYTPK